MTLCFCVQVTHATDIPPVVSDHGSLPRATLSSVASHLINSDRVPRCAMNTAYDYALPTQVALLMAGATVETVDAETPKKAKRGPFHVHGGGRRGGVRGLQLPMHAATQPSDLASLRPVGVNTEDSGGSGCGGGSVPGCNTAPLASARPDALRQDSLVAESEAGSTVMLLPHLASSGSDPRPDHTQGQTVGGTETVSQMWDGTALSLPPLPPPPPTPRRREIFGIRLEWEHDTESTRDSTGSSALRGGRQQRWRRSWLAAPVAPSTVDSATDEISSAAVLTAQQLMDRLQQQLDGFKNSDEFLGRFEMLGRHARRRGGVPCAPSCMWTKLCNLRTVSSNGFYHSQASKHVSRKSCVKELKDMKGIHKPCSGVREQPIAQPLTSPVLGSGPNTMAPPCLVSKCCCGSFFILQ